jgi:hypothetical protein
MNKFENCPICLDKIFNNFDDIKLLNCSHMIHKKCFNELCKNADLHNKIPQCTICKKSAKNYMNYNEKFDKYILYNPVDNFSSKWKSEILCNDCCNTSEVKYHTKYLKCLSCNSYNTSQNKIIKLF